MISDTRLIISILVTTVITASLHSIWLETDAKKTYMREAFAIKDIPTIYEKIKTIKTAADVSLNSGRVTVPQNVTDNKPLITDSILGVIVGGVIGFLSGVGVDWLKRRLTRPKIIINEETTEVDFYLKKREIHGIVGGPVIEPEYSFTRYTGTRIKVENDGPSAAEGCKATLITDETELRVGWMIPEQDSTVTINAHDVEHLDLCAISEDDNNRVLTTERGYGDYVDSGRASLEWRFYRCKT